MTRTALIVVDVQNDFCEGGALAVAGGNTAAARIAHQADTGHYDLIVATRDWHIDPGAHFAPDGEQPDYANTWPRHCVADTPGAELHPAIDCRPDVIVSKGQHAAAYSGFEGTVTDGARPGQPLTDLLREYGIGAVDVCGIATDYCVKATVLDALAAGYPVRVLTDLCAAVDPDGTGPAAEAAMRDAGATLVVVAEAA